MQKYGLLYANTENLGDDIQALAAKQFLPQVDYYIERDSIQDFFNTKQNNVKTILNAWWTHNENSWPPPNNINPLLISIHVYNKILSSFISEKSKKYCSNKEFGARDQFTCEILKKNGFENVYLSYCLTLTFPKYLGERNNDILYVDAYENNQELTHHMPNLIDMHPQERLEIARQRLELYKKAKLVVTSRLHCALPCLAFGTPIKFINANFFDASRMSGYSNILQGEQDISLIRNMLINKCKQFVEN